MRRVFPSLPRVGVVCVTFVTLASPLRGPCPKVHLPLTNMASVTPKLPSCKTARFKQKKASSNSTDRRETLATFIEKHGDVMPRACSECREHRRVCRVHVRSGRCGQCNLHNSKCDIRITENEWKRLGEERRKLIDALETARDETSRAVAKERRLLAQLDLVEQRVDNARAVDAREVAEVELSEAPEGQAILALSPFTWSALDGIPDDFFTADPPGYLLADSSTVGESPSK